MNSLRFRLILGFSLVAVIPLVVAMVLLSQRVQSTVRTQAADRLGATLGILQAQLHTDGERIVEKLGILGRDPLLKRLYLLEPAGARDLAEYLAEKRFLLGLDFLLVADTSGNVVADASSAPSAPGRAGTEEFQVGAGDRRVHSGVVVERLEGVPGLAMAARAPILYRNETVGMLRGGVVLDAGFLERLKQTSGVDLVLRDGSGHAVAWTLENGAGSALPLRDGAEGRSLTRDFSLDVGPGPHASITGIVSTASADQTIGALRVTSIVLGLLGVGIAIALGVLWSLQVSRPVERLARFSQRIAQGDWDEPLTLHSVRELQTLVSALDRMRGDLSAYREKLVVSERHAAWSQMARKVAHEIRNPLTPIAVSVADLQRSFTQKRADFPEILDQAVKTIGEEVQTLKHLLQEFSEFGRLPEPRMADCRVTDLLADLRTLYGRDVAEGRLTVSAPATDLVFTADRAQLGRALVNLVKNGLEAVESGGRVEVAAREEGAALEIVCSDTGPGLTAEQKAHLFVPYFTTKAHGSGLGLTIVERIVTDHQGTISVDSGPGPGTTFRIRLPIGQEAEECRPSSSSTTKKTSSPV